MESHGEHLFYQWNTCRNLSYPGVIEVHDETLRDGLQASGLRQPRLKDKLKMVALMAALGIDVADIGFPAAGPAIFEQLKNILRYIGENKFSITTACAARTVEEDIRPIVDLSQQFGIPIIAYIFVGSSPIRQFVEGWNVDYILSLVEKAVTFAVKHDLLVCFVTEDTTRSKPEDLEKIYLKGIESGASRICLCDTVGYATPVGAAELVYFIRSVIEKRGLDVRIDWHGHNDRGLALANALSALEAGANRIHATGLGIGERSGNTSMEQLLINLDLMGLRKLNGLKLKEYGMTISRACQVPIPDNLPILGRKVFATATGVHAAAIIKAQQMNDNWLADRVYSSVPAKELGAEQIIEIGPMSGKCNVKYFLEKNNINDESLQEDIFNQTKKKGQMLTPRQMEQLFKKHGYRYINSRENPGETIRS